MAAGPAKTFAILKRKLVEAYFSKAILLVEGDTEEGAFLAFNAALREGDRGLDLHKQELTLFNANGLKEIRQLLDALRPLPVRKILFVDNDQDDTFYSGLRPKVDLLVRTPKTPAGDDFEAMIAWQSPREILEEALEQQMRNRKLAARLPRSFKGEVHRLKQEGGVTAKYLDQLLEFNSTQTYFKDACPVLAAWEAAEAKDKGTIRGLYAEAFRQFKGFRAAFEWGSLYEMGQVPAGIAELLQQIHNLLDGKISSGAEHVLAEGSSSGTA